MKRLLFLLCFLIFITPVLAAEFELSDGTVFKGVGTCVEQDGSRCAVLDIQDGTLVDPSGSSPRWSNFCDGSNCWQLIDRAVTDSAIPSAWRNKAGIRVVNGRYTREGLEFPESGTLFLIFTEEVEDREDFKEWVGARASPPRPLRLELQGVRVAGMQTHTGLKESDEYRQPVQGANRFLLEMAPLAGASPRIAFSDSFSLQTETLEIHDRERPFNFYLSFQLMTAADIPWPKYAVVFHLNPLLIIPYDEAVSDQRLTLHSDEAETASLLVHKHTDEDFDWEGGDITTKTEEVAEESPETSPHATGEYETRMSATNELSTEHQDLKERLDAILAERFLTFPERAIVWPGTSFSVRNLNIVWEATAETTYEYDDSTEAEQAATFQGSLATSAEWAHLHVNMKKASAGMSCLLPCIGELKVNGELIHPETKEKAPFKAEAAFTGLDQFVIFAQAPRNTQCSGNQQLLLESAGVGLMTGIYESPEMRVTQEEKIRFGRCHKSFTYNNLFRSLYSSEEVASHYDQYPTVSEAEAAIEPLVRERLPAAIQSDLDENGLWAMLDPEGSIFNRRSWRFSGRIGTPINNVEWYKGALKLSAGEIWLSETRLQLLPLGESLFLDGIGGGLGTSFVSEEVPEKGTSPTGMATQDETDADDFARANGIYWATPRTEVAMQGLMMLMIKARYCLARGCTPAQLQALDPRLPALTGESGLYVDNHRFDYASGDHGSVLYDLQDDKDLELSEEDMQIAINGIETLSAAESLSITAVDLKLYQLLANTNLGNAVMRRFNEEKESVQTELDESLIETAADARETESFQPAHLEHEGAERDVYPAKELALTESTVMLRFPEQTIKDQWMRPVQYAGFDLFQGPVAEELNALLGQEDIDQIVMKASETRQELATTKVSGNKDLIVGIPRVTDDLPKAKSAQILLPKLQELTLRNAIGSEEVHLDVSRPEKEGEAQTQSGTFLFDYAHRDRADLLERTRLFGSGEIYQPPISEEHNLLLLGETPIAYQTKAIHRKQEYANYSLVLIPLNDEGTVDEEKFRSIGEQWRESSPLRECQDDEYTYTISSVKTDSYTPPSYTWPEKHWEAGEEFWNDIVEGKADPTSTRDTSVNTYVTAFEGGLGLRYEMVEGICKLWFVKQPTRNEVVIFTKQDPGTNYHEDLASQYEKAILYGVRKCADIVSRAMGSGATRYAGVAPTREALYNLKDVRGTAVTGDALGWTTTIEDVVVGIADEEVIVHELGHTYKLNEQYEDCGDGATRKPNPYRLVFGCGGRLDEKCLDPDAGGDLRSDVTCERVLGNCNMFTKDLLPAGNPDNRQDAFDAGGNPCPRTVMSANQYTQPYFSIEEYFYMTKNDDFACAANSVAS